MLHPNPQPPTPNPNPRPRPRPSLYPTPPLHPQFPHPPCLLLQRSQRLRPRRPPAQPLPERLHFRGQLALAGQPRLPGGTGLLHQPGGLLDVLCHLEEGRGEGALLAMACACALKPGGQMDAACQGMMG